jgi:hypothetical protein
MTYFATIELNNTIVIWAYDVHLQVLDFKANVLEQ